MYNTNYKASRRAGTYLAGRSRDRNPTFPLQGHEGAPTSRRPRLMPHAAQSVRDPTRDFSLQFTKDGKGARICLFQAWQEKEPIPASTDTPPLSVLPGRWMTGHALPDRQAPQPSPAMGGSK